MNGPSQAFSRAGTYAAIVERQRTGGVKEQRAHDYGAPASERHLQCVWYDDSLRPRILRTHDGEDVVVDSPGRWNLEAGPDFLDAVLTIGREQRRVAGDVELHLHPSDWNRHGHCSDPLYANVVAHVSFFEGSIDNSSLPPRAVQVSLKEALDANPFFSFDGIDVAAYPFAMRNGRTPCGKALELRGPGDVIELLEAAGEERLRRKTSRIVSMIARREPEEVLYEEIMCALGYRKNRPQFRQVARRIPVRMLRTESGNDTTCAYALLLGVSGLMPHRVSPRWGDETRAYIRRLWDLWWKKKSACEQLVMPAGRWSLGGQRPHNHPLRRLCAAAALFAPEQRRLFDRLKALDDCNPSDWIRKATGLFSVPAPSEYWRRRLSFSRPPHDRDISLLGRGRIVAILANAVVPFLVASGSDALKATEILRRLPAEQDNSAVRSAAFFLLGRDRNPAVYRTSLRQQGLLQVFHDFCLNDYSACRSCSLPTALGAFAHSKAP